MRLLTVSLALGLLLVPAVSAAQEDTTPPVLLGFTVSPVAFDTGGGPVGIEVCATAADDLSPFQVNVNIVRVGGLLCQRVIGFPTPEQVERCGICTAPQFSAYDTYLVEIRLGDVLNNEVIYLHPDSCDFGPCELQNRPSTNLPDADGDGVPDDADNCPAVSNPGQEDADLDLIGDVCDPFPNDRDNEQAQCDADLTQTLDDLAVCQAQNIFQDDDGDGVEDSNDACLGTPTGALVDGVGCSRPQFCTGVQGGGDVCRASDWRNDEPLAVQPGDCAFDGQACVAIQGQPSCGLGPEIALLLPLFLAWRARRRTLALAR